MRRRIVLVVLAVLLVAAASLEMYARWPSRVEVAPLRLDPATRSAILLFHGRNGRDEPTLAALEQRIRELTGGRADTVVQRYNWSPHSDTRFRSEMNGARVGTVLGEELARLPRFESVRLVSHSAGAFLLDSICMALEAAAEHPVRVEMTYLDPIGFRGAYDAGWGARHYGRCADYAEAYVNLDDNVPATNALLEQAYNVDVTAAREHSSYEGGGHRWPVRYYLDHVTPAELVPGAHTHAARPRGAVDRR